MLDREHDAERDEHHGRASTRSSASGDARSRRDLRQRTRLVGRRGRARNDAPAPTRRRERERACRDP